MLRVAIPYGELGRLQLRTLADVADQEELRVHHEQNLLLPSVPVDCLFDLWKELQPPLALIIGSENELNFDLSDTDSVEMVVIQFTNVMDGRGFSLAAMLREKFDFTGWIHAQNVLEDNIAFMQQCGFDSIQLNKGSDFRILLCSCRACSCRKKKS